MRKASSSLRTGYQKGYQLGNRGGAAPKGSGPTAAVKSESASKLSSGRSGGRRKQAGESGDISISYSDLIPVGDLETVADFGKDTKPGKALKLGKALDYAKQKGDKGSGFNYRKRR